ncbi:MAG: EamA family transporter [Bryobacteraceae bacterium]
MSPDTTPFSSVVLVLLASIIGSFGAVFLKLGAARWKGDIWGLISWRLALGVALYLGSSVFFLMGIKHGQLSVLYPMVALGYVWALLWARIFFQEKFTRQKQLGLGLVIIGVVCVGLGS